MNNETNTGRPPVEDLPVTDRQKELAEKHGTPEQFEKAIWKAWDDLFLTSSVADAAIKRYRSEWDAAAWVSTSNAPDDLPAVAGKVRRDVGLSQILWEHEDELPEMSDDEFSAIFPASRLSEGSCGVRVYPFVKDAAGNKIFISEPNNAVSGGGSAPYTGRAGSAVQ
jgi:hypothetical protein